MTSLSVIGPYGFYRSGSDTHEGDKGHENLPRVTMEVYPSHERQDDERAHRDRNDAKHPNQDDERATDRTLFRG